MTRIFLALIALLAFGGIAHAQPTTWEKSFIPPQVDGLGHFMGGTEVRALKAFGGKLYAGNGYWMDQPGPEGFQSAQVLVLDSAHGSWRQDVSFSQFCPKFFQSCALATSVLDKVSFSSDKTGAPVNTSILVAATWDQRKPNPINVYAKNNADGLWYETTLETVDNKWGNVRSFGSHVDAVTKQSWAFAGSAPIGIHVGLLSDRRGASKNPIEWRTGAGNVEFNGSDYAGPKCKSADGADRVTSFAEAANGKLYAAICFQVLERQDGDQASCNPQQVLIGGACRPRWKVVWTDRDVGISETGVRGLTATTYLGTPVLLAGEEGGVMRIVRIDPATGASNTEIDVRSTESNYWNMLTAYGISAYNNMPSWLDLTGPTKQLIGVETLLQETVTVPKPDLPIVLLDNGQKWEGDAYYFTRNLADSYELIHIPRLTTTGMVAVRAEERSPFSEECNPQFRGCVIYFAGFDANSSTTQTLCTVPPCTIPPLVRFPTHNTGWIVKGSGFTF
jgi:hypothetical protein